MMAAVRVVLCLMAGLSVTQAASFALAAVEPAMTTSSGSTVQDTTPQGTTVLVETTPAGTTQPPDAPTDPTTTTTTTPEPTTTTTPEPTTTTTSTTTTSSTTTTPEPTTTTTSTPTPTTTHSGPWNCVLSRLGQWRRSVHGLAFTNSKLFVISVNDANSFDSSHHSDDSSDDSDDSSRSGPGSPQSALLEVFTRASATPLRQFHLSYVVPRDLAVSPDGSRLYVADVRSGAVIVYDAATGARLAGKSWSLGRSCSPDTLAVTSDDVIIVTCSDSKIRKCFQDGTVRTVSLSSQISKVDHVIQLSGGRLAALVRPSFTNKQAVCLSDISGQFSGANCFHSSLNAPVYLAALTNDYLLVADRSAAGSIQVYGPQLESGLTLSIPAGRVLSDVRRVAVDVKGGLLAVAFNTRLMVFNLACTN